MGSPDCKDLKNAMEVPDSYLFWGFVSVNQVPQKLTSPIGFYKSLQSGLAMDLTNTPIPRVSCHNDENPEKKNFEKKKFEKKISNDILLP